MSLSGQKFDLVVLPSPACKIHILCVGPRCVEATAGQISKHDGRAGGGAEASRHRDIQGAARAQSGAAAESLPPLPQWGKRLTEDQMRERFGVTEGGGIRESLTLPDIILVRNVHSGYDDVEEGRHVLYDGQYYDGSPNQLILKNLKMLAKISADDGAVTWMFGGGPCGNPNMGADNAKVPTTADATGDSAHVLSMAERLSPDMDSGRPYRPEIERRIADCKAGRPIGKTYTAGEYLEHLEREHGIGALERPE